jgi:hypothetical protein
MLRSPPDGAALARAAAYGDGAKTSQQPPAPLTEMR